MKQDNDNRLPPDPDARRAVLDLIGGRGGMTLAGNKESFAVLYFRNGRWLLKEGDTMSGDSTIDEIDGDAAYRRIRWRVLELMEVYGPDVGIVSDAEVFDFLADYPTSI